MPAARIGDNVLQTAPHCHAPIHPPAPTPTPIPHPPMPLAIVKGEPTVMIGGSPAARATDSTAPCSIVPCVPGGPGLIVQGSATVMIGKLPAARVNDGTAHASCVAPIPSPKGQVMPPCCPTVMIGGATMSVVPPPPEEEVSGGPADPSKRSFCQKVGDFFSGEGDKKQKAYDDYQKEHANEVPYKGVIIKGDPDYVAKVEKDLDKIEQGDPNLLKKLQQQGADGKPTIITKGSPNDCEPNPKPDNSPDAWVTPPPPSPYGTIDKSTNPPTVIPNPKGGTGSVVHYDPDGGVDESGKPANRDGVPPDVGLDHELHHAVHHGDGETITQFPDNDDNMEESRTMGLPPWPKDNSENGYRQNRPPPPPLLQQRDSHHCLCPKPHNGTCSAT
jgi:hypothetical protein